MQLSKKLKPFSQFFSSFLKYSSNSEHYEKKMTFIANVFLKLKIVKHMVRLLFG